MRQATQFHQLTGLGIKLNRFVPVCLQRHDFTACR
ncbi:Uncharacterised protein [Vibrio cholerae]|nr:Uncharacterised protein [Vibrio cholerae]